MPRSRRSQHCASESRNRVDEQDEGWFTIRRILAEKRVNGNVQYLVDWDDNEETGEVYTPTWSLEVTEAALEDWEAAKRAENEQQHPQLNQESEGPSLANWRHLLRSQARDALGSSHRPSLSDRNFDQRPRKIAKLAHSATPSEEPVPSIVSTSSNASCGSPDRDLADDLSQRAPDSPPTHRLVVELPKDPDLDASTFISDYNTQSSGTSSQSLAELEDQDERLIFASQLSRRTVPDSEEPSGQTWSVDQQDHDPIIFEESQDSEPRPTAGPDPVASRSQSASSAANFSRTSRNHHTGSSNTLELQQQEIPSHQISQAQSDGIASQELHLATPATRPQSEYPSNDIESIVVPATSPIFLSQPPISVVFGPLESPSTQNNTSSIRSAIAQTPLDREQDSATTTHETGTSAEVQDAQVIHVDLFVSHVEAFTESHSSQHNNLETRAVTSPEERPGSPTRSSTEVVVVSVMEGQAAPDPLSSAPRVSAVDELNQIFTLSQAAIETPHANEVEVEPLLLDGADSQVPLAKTQWQHTDHAQPDRPVSEIAGQESEHNKPVTLDPRRLSAVRSLETLDDSVLDVPHLPAAEVAATSTLHSAESPSIILAQVLNAPSNEAVDGNPVALPGSCEDDAPSATNERPNPSEPRAQQQEQDFDDGSTEASRDPIQSKYVVTLPFQASLRPLYDDTLLKARGDVTNFSAAFTTEVFTEPDTNLVQTIDQLFDHLYNICDYPSDAVGTALAVLPPDQLIKYCCDANSKFNFLYELLQGLKKETRILIVARSPEILRLLCQLTQVLEIECLCKSMGNLKSGITTSVARVTLALPQEAVDTKNHDIVIGYDYSFSGSISGKSLAEKDESTVKPLLLLLVITHSIEHIDLHITDNLVPLERKNALLSGVVRARQLVGDPDRGYLEPHEVAHLFLNYLNGIMDDITWDPVSVPDEVLDFYLNSRSQPQSRFQEPAADVSDVEHSRKRKLDKDDPDGENVKRMRMSPEKQPAANVQQMPLPDEVQELLRSVQPEKPEHTALGTAQVQVNVSLDVLQALAEKTSELKRQLEIQDKDEQYKSIISNLEVRIKEYERTSKQMYTSTRLALEDRTKFEQQALKADGALKSATEDAQRDADKAQRKIAELEATVRRLTASPDGAEETPLAKTHKIYQESLEKIRTLEKRLQNARKDADYARDLYQDATSSAGALRGENAELKEKNAELSKKTAETLGKIHSIQSDNTINQLLGQIRDLKAQVREREIELDHTKEESRQLRSGRRETRQISVPRSPRMGMMSPRVGRTGYGGGGSVGGSTSRGTSPAAPLSATEGQNVSSGMQFTAQPPGNGRWNHLRD